MISSVSRRGPAFLLRITWAISESFIGFPSSCVAAIYCRNGQVGLGGWWSSARGRVTVRTPRLKATSGARTSATACSGVVASNTTMSAGVAHGYAIILQIQQLRRTLCQHGEAFAQPVRVADLADIGLQVGHAEQHCSRPVA